MHEDQYQDHATSKCVLEEHMVVFVTPRLGPGFRGSSQGDVAEAPVAPRAHPALASAIEIP
jgi:hypothetical protein